MMDRLEMLVRFAFYCAIAAKDLRDRTYVVRFLGRPEKVTEGQFVAVSEEIFSRLEAAGMIQPGEDPFDTMRLASN